MCPSRTDTDSGRFYEVENIGRVPSVTTILSVISKPALIRWAASQERTLVTEAAAALYADIHGMPKMNPAGFMASLRDRLGKVRRFQREQQKAAEIGSQAHAKIEWVLRGLLGQEPGPMPVTSSATDVAVVSWMEWWDEMNFTPKYIEQVVWSRVDQFAGTADLIGSRDGKLYIFDWKTSKAIYPEAKLQLAAYRVALAEMGHGVTQKGYIVRLPKTTTDPGFEVLELSKEELAALYPTFLAARELWQWQHEEEEKRKTQ